MVHSDRRVPFVPHTDAGKPLENHRIDYTLPSTRKRNMHSSHDFAWFLSKHLKGWRLLLETVEPSLVKLRNVALHTVGLLAFDSLQRRSPLQRCKKKDLEAIINLRVRSYRYYKCIEKVEEAKPSVGATTDLHDNEHPDEGANFLPETLFLVFRRSTKRRKDKSLAEAIHGTPHWQQCYSTNGARASKRSQFRKERPLRLLEVEDCGALIKDLATQVVAVYKHFGLYAEEAALYYRTVRFEEEEFAFVGLELHSIPLKRFVDEFQFNYLPPFIYEYIALSFNDHRGYVRGYENPFSTFAEQTIRTVMGNEAVTLPPPFKVR